MLELKNNIFYVGVKDPTLRTFDIFMKTEYGTTYNAYLVKGEKTALIETAHEKLLDSYISNIEEIMPVSEIDYLICNHTEPDHSGSVKKILELNPDVEVVGSIAAIRNLKEITNMTFKEHIAKDGAELDLGDGKVLKFCIVPNLHWPDTMVTYLESEKTLFSCDVFGAHYCEDAVVDEDIIYYDKYEKAMKVYYDCIVSPFNAFVVKALEKLSALDIEMVCNSHGPVLKKYIAEAVKKYSAWSAPKVTEKKTVAIFYASAYGYTKKMADTIAKTLNSCDFDVKEYDVAEINDEMITALHSADALVFGTPSINRNAVKPVWDIISSIDLVNMKNKPCFVFGSYGWGGEGIQLVHNHLELLKLKPFEKPFGCIFNPSDEKLAELEDYTKKFAETI